MNLMLEGIRVLDLTHYMAGPFCTMVLADLGAEVIKIEPPWGETIRMSPPLIKGLSPEFAFLNRNKKGMTLNLKTDEGLKIFKDLVRVSDVVIENFRPGTMDDLGLGYKVLREINSKIIYASISGFGQFGPYSSRPSFDMIAQAYSGIMTLTSDLNDSGEIPTWIADFIGDSVPALFTTIGVLAALYHRKNTGRGQRIDVAQLDSMISILPSIVYYMLSGLTIPQVREKYSFELSGVFKARDDYVFISAIGRQFDNFSEVTGVKNIDNKQAVSEWVKDRSVEEVVNTLVKAGVPVAPILSVDKVIKDPQVLARGMIFEVDHPEAGKIKLLSLPLKFSEKQEKPEHPPPLLGQNNEEILSRLLRYSEGDLIKLKEKGVI